ncbi:DNA internalization-related competence protein ComEC/Rec2 [Lactobacillus kefiranofaciens subsp. kefirgranum]|uniref:DNA internalization-related competence protein ComEC/Rec2 n=1 Tax=Lactobacillus kefiranofaciens TaxID=267818 RepID=UPI00202FE6C9|nr:DNA internalization-related competence protein ComEC/Rec2 [Lactobacillus kefiranofaciens]URW72194.1 DNA internalization-related competence protein ComEC/Rec2 [Lactobacillus kefiranofaciens subsp. kefirgranum]URW74125.1 DNA internalization-related competence protein ComEC/Rec2 [Lactobacillus kefiranofaciens subsp. kefirgranum]
MKVSKISWLFRQDLGFYLLTALLLVAISFLAFSCSVLSQQLVAIVFLLYFSFLLFKKYRTSFKLVLLTAVTFASLIYVSKKEIPFNLTAQSQVKLYPDQIRIKDDYLTGVGHYQQGNILISVRVTKEQEKLLKEGRPVLLTQITGECDPIEPATNQGEFDYQNYYLAKRISQRIKYTSCNLVLLKSQNLFDYLHEWRFYLQNYFNRMPQLLGFFGSELVLGENNAQENQEILNNYRNLGVIHLLSISGLHVGIYVLLISIVCFYLKLTDEETFACCSLVLLLGIFLSSGQAGFVRASLTYFLGKICKFKHYRVSQPDLLGLTCILHILLVPRLFMAAGAILSYILAAGLQLTNRFNKLTQSILLNVLLTPLLLFFFYQVNLLTVLFNMLVVPYFNYVVMPVTFINILTFWLTDQLALMEEQILNLGEKAIAKLSLTKWGLITFGQINWWQCLTLLLLTALLIIAWREKTAWYFDKKQLEINLFMVYAIFFSMIHFPLRGQVTFIDVGQGDSILITTPFPRKVYLIDTGGKLNFTGKKQTPQVNRITLPFLKSQGISVIDGIFVSHQDADHVGDLGPLLEQIRVKKLFMAKGLINNPSFQKRINGRVRNTKLVELLAGMQVREPKITFNVVYPYQPGEGKNEDSLSVFFKVANRSWLFTGDLGQDGEKEIMQKTPFTVDYFKLGHHGSKTSSNPGFLQAIKPKKVFISAGRKNRFGHPHQETLTTLRQQQIPWVSTQDCGMISWYYGGLESPKFDCFLKRRRK